VALEDQALEINQAPALVVQEQEIKRALGDQARVANQALALVVLEQEQVVLEIKLAQELGAQAALVINQALAAQAQVM